MMRPNMVKRGGKATPSTSSGGSSNKGNEVKAKNYYDRMQKEHNDIKPVSLAEQRNRHKSEKNKLQNLSPGAKKPNMKDSLDFNPSVSEPVLENNILGPLFDVDESAIGL